MFIASYFRVFDSQRCASRLYAYIRCTYSTHLLGSRLANDSQRCCTVCECECECGCVCANENIYADIGEAKEN